MSFTQCKILEYCLQREDYWVKTLCFTYPFELSEKPKFINKSVPVGKLFSPPPRYGEHFLNARTRNNFDKRILSFDISISLNYIKQFPIKSRSDECCKLLESFKNSEQKNRYSNTRRENSKIYNLYIFR